MKKIVRDFLAVVFLCLLCVAPTHAENEHTIADSNISDGVSMSGLVSVNDLSVEKGTFRVDVSLTGNTEDVADVAVVIWNEAKGQSDAETIIAVRNEDGVYSADMNIRNHGYSFGKYKISAYITDKPGMQFLIGTAECSLDAVQSAPEVRVINENQLYQLSLKNFLVPGGVSRVLFAVWNGSNAGDTLMWYEGNQTQENLYQTQWNVKNHTGLGQYDVHAYAVSKAGDYVFMGATTISIAEPQVSSIDISKIDVAKGRLQITIQSLRGDDLIKNIVCPVWSEKNGQDDIVWYEAQKKGLNQYTVDVDIKNHKFDLGNYNIHAYLTDITGYRYLAGTLQQSMDVEKGQLEIKQKTDDKFLITLKDILVPGGVSEVLIPVWTTKSNAADIKWYRAKKQPDGKTYQVELPLKNHQALGEFQVHAYAATQSGELVFLEQKSFTVDEPKVGRVEITEYSVEKGTFMVNVLDIVNDEYIQEVQVPVWSEKDGQDDICWYTATKSKDGQYVVKVDLKNHKYTFGKYNIHVYIQDITGNRELADARVQNIGMEPGELSVTKKNDSTYEVKLENAVVPGGVREILFPIWSEKNGQDDICWYTATKKNDGTYSAQILLENHKGLGKFNVHSYVMNKNGEKFLVGTSEFVVKEPKIGSIEIVNVDKENGRFSLKISGIQNGDLIHKIEVPIWSEEYQRDIVWYVAKENSTGEYLVEADIKDHNYNLKEYNVHVYMIDVTGNRQFVGSSACNMQPQYSALKAVDISGTESIYKISLEGLEVPSGERNVSFAVWGVENGQNDIRWYQAQKQRDGTYTTEIAINNHKELGQYWIHVYCNTGGEINQFVGGTELSVTKRPQIASMQISDTNGQNGTFRVTISGVFAASGVNKVEMPVWCSNNQSDIAWYQANRVAEGVYTAMINVENHVYHFGDYKIHAYVTMGNGVRVPSGESAVHLDPVNYVYSNYISSTQREIVILGVQGNRVQFPTWSEENGQDDIVWYEGGNCGNGVWNTIVDSRNHKNGGAYTTHTYVTSGANRVAAGTTKYSLQWLPTDMGMMQARANMYSSPTPYIALVNRSTHKVGIFQGWQGNWNCIRYWDCSDGAPSTPTVEGVFRVGSRGYYFDSGSSRCYWYTQFYGNYLFHSVLYSKYNGSLVDGRLGMALSHGCVRLDINNAKWIYDTIPSGTTVVVYH